MGSLYWRGDILWAKYYQNGRAIRRSTKTGKETEAIVEAVGRGGGARETSDASS